MENPRAKTLEALEAFLHTQRALLARTQSDIARLRRLKEDVAAQPEELVENLSHELSASAFKLSAQLDCAPAPPANINWSAFAGHDPAPLHALARSLRHARAQRHAPAATQRAGLSYLQRLVKDARRTIVDPVLADFALLSEPEPDDEAEEPSAEELRRAREREKIHALRRHRIRACGLTLPDRARGERGVFIRRDVEDESAEVDIWDDGEGERRQVPGVQAEAAPMDVDPTTPASPPATPRQPAATPTPPAKVSRERRPSKKLKHQAAIPDPPSIRKSKKAATVAKELDPEPPPPSKPVKKSRTEGKPKPETYKLAWSVSEQHLLERLLEEIPDGEKNRWQKISQAMNGRRTPRQVASRVQKYFEKLKRFGIEVAGGSGHAVD